MTGTRTSTRTTVTRERTGYTAAQLRRLSGAALIAALPLQVVGFALHPPGEELQHVLDAAYGPSHLVLFVSWVLAALGLPALYAVQAHRAGRLGLTAFVATTAAVAYHLYLTLFEATAIPVLADRPEAQALVGDGAPMSHGAGALGPVAALLVLAFPLLGLATVRARVLPPLAGWLQLACVPTFVVLMLGIGAVTGGQVGPDATSWAGGMLPIASLYWVLFTGYAAAGWALRSTGAAPADALPAEQSTPSPSRGRRRSRA